MTDRTNAPYDPTAAETSHEWAARVGQEHDTWHRPDGDTPPPPTIVLLSLSDESGMAGLPIVIQLVGSGFTNDSVAHADGAPLPTTLRNTAQLTATWTPPVAGDSQITVVDGAVTSNALPFTVIAEPVITSIDPASIVVNVPTLVRVLGTDFKSNAVIWQDGGKGVLATTYVSDTELTVTLVDDVADNTNIQVQDGTGKWYSAQFPVPVTAA